MKDTVYRSDGSLASGTVVITWPAFVASDIKAVFGGTKTLQLTNGALAVALVPNSGGTPSGTSYNVKYFQSGGVFFEETWVVPTSSPVASPAAPTSVTQTGTPGTTTYHYWVSATNANGETLLGLSRVTTTSNATLSMTNYNVITWASVSGATGYRVWRTSTSTAPTGTGNYLVGSTASTTLNDQSNTLSSAAVPTLNTTDPRTLSQVRVTSAPSSTVTLAASQVQGTAIVSNPSSTQTISAPAKAGVIPLQLKGNTIAAANAFEIYDSQANPALQSWFDLNGAFKTSKAPTFSTFTSGSLLFAGTGGLLSQDNTNLFFDDTANGFRAGPPATSFTAGSIIRDQTIPRSLHNISAIDPTGSGGVSYALGASLEDTTTKPNYTVGLTMEDRHASGTKSIASAASLYASHYGAGAVTQLNVQDNYSEHIGTGAVTNFRAANYYLSHGAYNASSTAGATTNMEVMATGADISGTNTVSNLVGLRINTPTKAGSGTLTNNYGIKVDNQGGVGTNNWAIMTGTGKVQFGDALYAKSISNVRYADQFAGADAGAKIAAAIADLPSTGGTVDARGLEGSQTISSVINVGLISGPKTVRLLLGAATYTVATAVGFNVARQSQVVGTGAGTVIQSDSNAAGRTLIRAEPSSDGEGGISIEDVELRLNVAADVGINASYMTRSNGNNILIRKVGGAPAGTAYLANSTATSVNYRNRWDSMTIENVTNGVDLNASGVNGPHSTTFSGLSVLSCTNPIAIEANIGNATFLAPNIETVAGGTAVVNAGTETTFIAPFVEAFTTGINNTGPRLRVLNPSWGANTTNISESAGGTSTVESSGGGGSNGNSWSTVGGKYGLGTLSPNAKLHVFEGTSNNNGQMQVGGTTVGGLQASYEAIGSGRGAISDLNNAGGTNNQIAFGFGAVTGGVPANPVFRIDQSLLATYLGNLVPNATGQDLGATGQRWDVFGQNADFLGTALFARAVTNHRVQVRNTATANTANDAGIEFYNKDSLGNDTLYGGFLANSSTITDGSEVSTINLLGQDSGGVTLLSVVGRNGTWGQSSVGNFVPSGTGQDLGSSGARWDVFGQTGDFSKAYFSTLTTVTFSATPTFDASLGNSFKITLTGNITSSTISNPQTGESIIFLLCQDATGSRTMTWPTNLKLSGGSFTLTTTANKCDSLTTVYDGSNWYETARASNL